MKQLSQYHKPDIEYHMDLPEHPVILSTHEKYLSLVIEHLLNNANKFTEKELSPSVTAWMKHTNSFISV